jgi:phosphoglycerate dehydrogenase-like enzyme
MMVLPHAGAATTAYEPRMNRLLRRQISALQEGREPENVVFRT